MKKLYIFLLIDSTLSGCSKQENVDPREQYIGNYATTYQTVIITLATRESQSYASTTILTVSKGTDAVQLVISDDKSPYVFQLELMILQTLNRFDLYG